MALVQEMMTRNPCTLEADAVVSEAARRMRDLGIGDVIVMDGDQVAGILTDRDITVRGVAEGRDPNLTPLAAVCTPDPLTLSPSDDVDQAVDRMRYAAVRRLPVVDDGLAVGILSLGDLAMERDPNSVLAEISADAPNN